MRAVLESERANQGRDQSRWEQSRATLEREIARLAKWQHVADADVKAAELLETAQKARLFDSELWGE
jgi:hypothetical protein